MNKDIAEELYQFVKKVAHIEDPETEEFCAVFNAPPHGVKVSSGPCTCGKQKAEDILYRFATAK